MSEIFSKPTLPTFSWIGHLTEDDRDLRSSYGEFFPGHPGNVIIEEGALQTELVVVSSGKLSVRATEALIQEMAKKAGSTGNEVAALAKELTPVQSRLKNLALEITRSVGVKAEVKGNERRGKMVLHYSSREELERLIALMQNSR